MLRFMTLDELVRLFATLNSYNVDARRGLNAIAQFHFSRDANAQLWMGHEVPEPVSNPATTSFASGGCQR